VNSAAYDYWYPLQDWGWDRERCELEIVAAGDAAVKGKT
jgi:hypothetical protein